MTATGTATGTATVTATGTAIENAIATSTTATYCRVDSVPAQVAHSLCGDCDQEDRKCDSGVLAKRMPKCFKRDREAGVLELLLGALPDSTSTFHGLPIIATYHNFDAPPTSMIDESGDITSSSNGFFG